MAQIPLGGLSTLNLGTHLDAMFTELYEWRNLISVAPSTVTIDNASGFCFGFGSGSLKYNFLVSADADPPRLDIRLGSTVVMRLDDGGSVISFLQTSAPSLSTNGQMVFTRTSNTNVRLSMRGSDGVTRVANITLT